jgi:hypothetical protein
MTSEQEREFRASLRSKDVERLADKYQLTAILALRRPQEPNYFAAIDAALLTKIGRRLSAIAVANCNYGETPRRETEYDRLTERARTIAAWYGLTAESGGDPRGYVLRIFGEGLPRNSMGDGYGIA